MNEKEIKSIFNFYPEIKLVYFFGSKADGDSGPLSDYDFAVYFDSRDKKQMFNIKLELTGKLSKILKTDKIDLVILNLTEQPELKYNIIKDGKVIFEEEPFKVLIEPKILNEYFDFYEMLVKNNFTKA